MLLEVRFRTILIVLLMFVSVPPAVLFAEESKNPQSQLVLKEGLNYFYNSDYTSAGKKFDEYIALEPDDPIGYWRLAYSWYLRARMEQQVKMPKLGQATYQKFLGLTSRNIARAREKVEKARQDGNAYEKDFYLYVEAATYAIQGLAEVKYDFAAAQRDAKLMESLAEESGYPDAPYLVGYLNYEMSKQPWYVRWLSGLPHDRDKVHLIVDAAFHNTGPFVDDINFVIVGIAIEDREAFRQGEADRVFVYLSSNKKYSQSETLRKYRESRR